MANIKTTISFGLVNIPVLLNPIIKNNDTAFNQLHKKCGHRIKYIKYCPVCKKEVKPNEIIKGYEYIDNEYVTLTEEELDKLKVENDKTIEIIAFVKLKEIDPIYFEKSYVLNIDKPEKAYTLFKNALKKTGKVALAKTVINSKFYYVILRFGENQIIMTTLYFQEEIKLEEPLKDVKTTTKEMDLAIKLIDQLSGKFEPDKYVDEYQTRIKEAIDKKVAGKEIKSVKTKKPKNIANLLEALEKSLKDEG